MRFALAFFLLAASCLLLHFGSVKSMSDSYGHNPQHEFGSVWGQTLSPVVPFWTLEGDAFANQDLIRLVPDRQSKRGGMWNTEPNRFQSWEATFSVHIHGVSLLGADGMAFWYTKETAQLDGGFFGFTDQFTGLGVVIDTYDNDNTGLHPLLVAIVNDGTKKYTHSHEEGGEGPTNMEVGNCQLPIRNLGGTSIIRVSYRGRTLKVDTQLYGATTFSPCLVANNIDLPAKYHYGFTAATGQLADNHDVYGFSVRNLDANAAAVDSQRVFSTYDKYQIAEYLSKIYYEVSQDTPSSKSGGSNKPLDRSEAASLVHIGVVVDRLEGEVRKLTTLIEGNKNPVTGGGVNPALQAEIASLKTSLNNIVQKLGTVQGTSQPQQPPQQQHPIRGATSSVINPPGLNTPPSLQSNPAVSSGGILSYIIYFFLFVVVLGLSYLAFLFYRVKSEKEKKFF